MVVDDYCMGCAFHSPGVKCCNYLLVMGIRRGCPGGAGCDKKMTKKEFMEMGAPKDWNKELGKQMWAEGKGDAEIAKATGVTQGTISYFRRKHWEQSVVPGEAAAEVIDYDVALPQEALEEWTPAAEADPATPLCSAKDNEDEAIAKIVGTPALQDGIPTHALEQATQDLRGMDAVMTAQIIMALWNWSDPKKLQEAKAFLEYLIGRHEDG